MIRKKNNNRQNSGPLKKYIPKINKKSKSNHNTLRTNPNSELNLTLKLQRTLKKLGQNGYFRSEDQQLLMQSSRDQETSIKKPTQPIITQQFQQVNIQQMRYFSSHTKIVHKRNLAFFRGDMYQSMAVRIQRAWRRYRTKNLVSRYILKYGNFTQYTNRSIERQESISNSSQYEIKDSQSSKNIIIDTQNFYPEQANTRKVTYISNLEQDLSGYDEAVQVLKLEELTKWNKIISMISNHKSNDPNHIQSLLIQLMKQSQINKKDLQVKALKLKEQYSLHSSNSNKEYELQQGKSDSIQQISKKQNQQDILASKSIQRLNEQHSLDSDSQIPSKDFNSKKYIQYLDGDMFSVSKDQSVQQKRINQNNEINLQKAQSISTMIFNALIFDFLKQMSKQSNTILKKFKQYLIIVKPRPKKVQRAKKQGFKTNIVQVKQFILGLSDYILKQYIQILKNLEIPAGPTAIQMLSYMHPNEQNNIDQQQDDSSIMVLPNSIFDQYWKLKQNIMNLIYHQANSTLTLPIQKQQRKFQFLKGLNKVFYRALFDSFNQCLDYQRNYGQFGQPFPWKNQPLFYHSITILQSQNSIKRAQKRMFQIASMYCGLIVQKQDMGELCSNQAYLQQVQQDRLSRMLAQDLIDNQDRWIFYDDQETEILVQLSSLIYLSLTFQALEELCIIFK